MEALVGSLRPCPTSANAHQVSHMNLFLLSVRVPIDGFVGRIEVVRYWDRWGDFTPSYIGDRELNVCFPVIKSP